MQVIVINYIRSNYKMRLIESCWTLEVTDLFRRKGSLFSLFGVVRLVFLTGCLLSQTQPYRS